MLCLSASLSAYHCPVNGDLVWISSDDLWGISSLLVSIAPLRGEFIQLLPSMIVQQLQAKQKGRKKAEFTVCTTKNLYL